MTQQVQVESACRAILGEELYTVLIMDARASFLEILKSAALKSFQEMIENEHTKVVRDALNRIDRTGKL